MLIKGIILSLEENGCSVELPDFENVSGERAIASAIFAVQPGEGNGYKVGDVVIVGFELEKLDKPIVLGKLYAGIDSESMNTGTIKCGALRVNSSATLPGDTALVYGKTLTNDFKKYGTISDIVAALNATSAKTNSLEASVSGTQKWLDIRFNKSAYAIEVVLNNFGSEDVGSKILLYRSTRGRSTGRRGYSHPANLKANKGSVTGMGYGVFAGKSRSLEKTFPALPSWMPNSGLLQTEWTLTADHIDAGYLSIQLKRDWAALACPSVDNETVWCNIIGSGNYGTYGASATTTSSKKGALKIKFAFWNKRTNAISELTSTTFRFGAKLEVGVPASLVDTATGELLSHRLYISVK